MQFIGHHQQNNICIREVSDAEEKEKGMENLHTKIMAEKLLKSGDSYGHP